MRARTASTYAARGSCLRCVCVRLCVRVPRFANGSVEIKQQALAAISACGAAAIEAQSGGEARVNKTAPWSLRRPLLNKCDEARGRVLKYYNSNSTT